MNPILRHIQSNYVDIPMSTIDLSSQWTFTQHLIQLGPQFYRKIVPHHLLLNFEYSVLCNQLKTKLAYPDEEQKEQLRDQLVAALILAELMEQIYLNYLIVPREVKRLRQHQKVYRQLLKDWQGYTFSPNLPTDEEVDVGYSFAQTIRNMTAQANMYRQFFVRIKRLLDMTALVATNVVVYQRMIATLGHFTNPALSHLAWLFFLPRLLSNLTLILKHSVPGQWMSDEERSLPLTTRLEAQFLRRWFELGNDSIWVAVGLVNCFILTGALAPVGAYINFIFFGYDVILAALRAHIELSRLYLIRAQYKQLLNEECDPDNINTLLDLQKHLEERIHFEQERLGVNVAATVFLFIAVFFSIPALAFNPIFPLIGALILVATTIANYKLNQAVETKRPKDNIEKPSSLNSIGFFSKRVETPVTENAAINVDELTTCSANL